MISLVSIPWVNSSTDSNFIGDAKGKREEDFDFMK